jgi:hypothetical protein
MLLDWLYQTCPKCNKKSRRLVLSKKQTGSEAVDGSKQSWVRGGRWSVHEPVSVWLHSYSIERQCRACGHRWTERVTKQRPW